MHQKGYVSPLSMIARDFYFFMWTTAHAFWLNIAFCIPIKNGEDRTEERILKEKIMGFY